MTTYYIKDENEKIILWDTDRIRLVNTLDFMPQYKEALIWETENPIVDGVIYTEEELAEKEVREEQERINNLTMTSLDVIELIHSQGVEYTDIMAFLQANPMLNLQLTYCQNCYCGVVRQLCPLTIGSLTLTDELVVYAFRKKNGEDVQPPVAPVEENLEL